MPYPSRGIYLFSWGVGSVHSTKILAMESHRYWGDDHSRDLASTVPWHVLEPMVVLCLQMVPLFGKCGCREAVCWVGTRTFTQYPSV